VCATRDEPSSPALSLALPLADPAAAGACIPPVLVYEGDGSLSQRGYCVRRAPHAVARSRPPVLVCLTSQIRFRCCEQKDPLLSCSRCGERRSRPDKHLQGPEPQSGFLVDVVSTENPSASLSSCVTVLLCQNPNRLLFNPNCLPNTRETHQIQQRRLRKAVRVFRHAV
jgi:hypothetical protein